MKTFIVSMGNFFINLLAWISFIGINAAAIYFINIKPEISLGILIIGYICFFFTFWFLYILISINDNLTKISKLLETQHIPED